MNDNRRAVGLGATDDPEPQTSHRVVFLLGAGASVEAGVPATVEFVDRFRRHVSREAPEQRGSLSLLLPSLRRWARRRKRLADVELLYQVLTELSDPDPGFLVEQVPDARRVLSRSQAERLLGLLKDFIRASTFVEQGHVGYLEPLRHFVAGERPLEIYSTNYDTCVEQVCERLRLRWQDGFELHWEPGVFGRPDDDVNIRKLHGSVLWVQDVEGSYFRVPLRPAKSSGGSLMGLAGPCDPLIAYPGRKQSYEAPFVESLVALQRRLGESLERVLLVVIGYSFRDDHLLQILWDCARRNRNLRVVMVDPDAERIYRTRLSVIATRSSSQKSPLDGRVFRINLPVDGRLGTLRRLRAKLDQYEEALAHEEKQSVHAAHGMDWWTEVAQEFFKAGDLPSVYAYGQTLEWSGWQTQQEYHAQVRAALKEIRLLILATAKPPSARGLPKEGQELVSRCVSGCTVLFDGQYYMVRFSLSAGHGVSTTSLLLILQRELRRVGALARHPLIGRRPFCGPALRRLSVLLEQSVRFLVLAHAADQRGAVPESALEALSPGTTARLSARFGGAAGSPERAVAWQESLRDRIGRWGNTLHRFLGDQAWGRYQF